MGKIRAIIKRPDEMYGHVAYISNTLANLQKIVGGYIETQSMGRGNILIMNEEGKNLRLPPNLRIGGGIYTDTIAGTVIVLGVDGEEFCDCLMEFDVWKMMVDVMRV